MEHSDPLERATTRKISTETWTDDDFRAAREADLAERTVPVASMIRAVVLCLLLAMLLTSGKLVEIAERMEFGANRDRALDVAEGVDRVANLLSLNRPYDVITDLRDANNDRGASVAVTEAAPATSTTTVSTTTVAGASAQTTTSTSTTTTTMTRPADRTVTPDAPLRVYVAGDSQATYLGQAITTEAGGLALDVDVDDRISTSLARPDYFDWPSRWSQAVADASPEAVVLFLGANDHQDMVDATGQRLVEGTEAWEAEWRARLALGLDVLTADGATVFWITQPPMRDGRLDDGIEQINQLAAEVVEARVDVVVVDIWELFGGAAGYQQRIVGADGDVITARVDDGVHLTRSASSWVAELVFEQFRDRWEFAGTG